MKDFFRLTCLSGGRCKLEGLIWNQWRSACVVVTARTAPALVTAAGCMFVLNMLARLKDERGNPGNVNYLDTSQGLITSGCVDGRLTIKHRIHYAFDSYVDLLVEKNRYQ